jgi:hypothetical protein
MSELGVSRVGVVVLVSLVVLAHASLAADTPLAFGRAVEGRVGDASTFQVEVREAGLLTVVAHAGDDILLEVTDQDGQLLPDGRIDVDRDGDTGLELGTVALSAPGTYRIAVREFSGGGTTRFTLAASFLPFPGLARRPDPDGRPSGAVEMAIGESREGRIHGAAGDLRDWYRVAAPSAGTLTVITRAPGEDVGDLVLEAFLDGDYATSVQRSDQDIQGNRANESVSVSVAAGQTLHLRVSAHSPARDPIPYRISVGFLE